MTFEQKYGPWALITGASEGTGSAFAHKLADKGINLILIARRKEPLAELNAAINAKGVECISASVDLSSPDATRQIATAAAGREVGLFIANAGADTNGSLFLDNDVANWDQLVNLNVLSTMRNCHHFGRAMRERGRGGIIIVGSGACYGGLNGIAVYSAVKAFDLCFGEALWAELRHHNVDVLNLILGRTDTPAHRRLMERNGQPIPAGMADPAEVAEIGLARLPHGPDYNWGQDDDTAGYAPNSPAQRRARILAIEEMSKAYTGHKS
jgi:short-subunit dehydrogenase